MSTDEVEQQIWSKRVWSLIAMPSLWFTSLSALNQTAIFAPVFVLLCLYSLFCVLSNKAVQDLNMSNKLGGGNFFQDQFQIKSKK